MAGFSIAGSRIKILVLAGVGFAHCDGQDAGYSFKIDSRMQDEKPFTDVTWRTATILTGVGCQD